MLLSLTVLTIPFSSVQGDEEFTRALNAFENTNRILQGTECEDLFPPADCLIFSSATAGITNREQILRLMEERLHLRATAAQYLLSASLRGLPVVRENKRGFTNDLIQSVESDLLKAFRIDPENAATLRAVGTFYGNWGDSRPDFPEVLYDCIRQTNFPAMIVSAAFSMQDQVGLLSHGLQSDPDNLVLLDRAGEEMSHSSLGPAFYGKAYQFAKEDPNLDPNISLYFLTKRLHTLLDQGLLDTALQEFRLLSPETQHSVISITEQKRKLVLEGGDSIDAYFPNIASDLALTAFLNTDSKTMAAILTVEIPKPNARALQIVRDRQTAQELLLTHLASPKELDPFGDLQILIAKNRSDWSFPWEELKVRMLEQQEYFGAASYYLLQNADWLQRILDESPSRQRIAWPKALSSEAMQLEERLHGLVKELRSRAAVDQLMVSQTSPDGMTSQMMKLIEKPVTRFTEKPLPEGMKPIDVSDDELERLQAQWAGLCPAVHAGRLVRVEQQGDRIVAITESQRYDPVGEINGGGYWVLLSEDGGLSWPTYFYTGLRIMQPYVIRHASSLPLLSGDVLQVEVSERKLDTEGITFPPLGRSFKSKRDGIYLEIPLDALNNDSDQDGLTDLAEEHLMLDPQKPDTDGDSLNDSEDPLPQVPFQDSSERVAKALAAILTTIGRDEGARVYPSGFATLGALPKLDFKDERAAFFVGDRNLFYSLAPSVRTIVLTPEELDAAEKKFGPIYAYHLELFLLDQKQERGIVIWDANWVGGTLLLEWEKDHWRVKLVRSWIT